jgi:catechol 2,3-dioxygenase-like lactoylglutathione lyase family enzyme
MTMFRSLHTRLLVQNFRACLEFYRDLLGFAVTLEVEGDVYAELSGYGTLLSLYRRDFMAGVAGTSALPANVEAQDRVALILAVDNVDAAFAQLTERGVRFIQPPADQAAWVLRTAYLRDPDGTLIEINHSLYKS